MSFFILNGCVELKTSSSTRPSSTASAGNPQQVPPSSELPPAPPQFVSITPVGSTPTSQTRPTLTGKAPLSNSGGAASVSVRLYSDSGCVQEIGRGAVDSARNFSVTTSALSATPIEKLFSIYGRAFSQAGTGSSGCTYFTPYNLDTLAPALVAQSPANGSVVTSSAVTFSGTCLASTAITLFGDRSSPASATCASNGTFSIAVSLTSALGNKTVQLSQTDAAGNSTSISVSVVLSSSTTTSTVFTAIGDGGWTGTSCDQGKTWTIRNFNVYQDDPHYPWSSFGGIAVGGGNVAAGFGWGAPGHLLAMGSGQAWRDVTPSGLNYVSGVGYTGSEFVAFSDQYYRSTDGTSWHAAGNFTFAPKTDQVRQMRVFPEAGGLYVIAAEDQATGGGYWFSVSENDAVTWSTKTTSNSSSCINNTHYYGDIEYKGGILVAGADSSSICRSADRGKTWSSYTVSFTTRVRDVFSDSNYFYLLTEGGLYRSADGNNNWSQIARFSYIAGAGEAYNGVIVVLSQDGKQFSRSSDSGSTWEVPSGSPPASGNPPLAGTLSTGSTVDNYIRDFTAGTIAGVCQ